MNFIKVLLTVIFLMSIAFGDDGCDRSYSDQTLVYIENNFEDMVYTLSVKLSCEGRLKSLVKRVYDDKTFNLLEKKYYPLTIGLNQVMIQRLKLKDIIRFKIIGLDILSHGKVQVEYASDIFKNRFKTFIVNFKQTDGVWSAYDQNLRMFNRLKFHIKTNFFIPYKVTLKAQDYIDIPYLEKPGTY